MPSATPFDNIGQSLWTAGRTPALHKRLTLHLCPRRCWSKVMMQVDWRKASCSPGAEVARKREEIGQLEGIFAKRGALRAMDPNTVVYRVQAWCPVAEGTEGGLFWGSTTVEPGQVDGEYFMTHGHFHLKRDPHGVLRNCRRHGRPDSS